MAHNLSEEQRQAIEQRGGNILVAAGAGSGKTTVLTERVLSLVCGDTPKDIDRLLVLTFTNAAAAEMRSRIEESLDRRLLAKPGDKHLIRQLDIVQQAPITTIHAFCLDILRRYFYHLDLDAGFSVPSEMERTILREETMEAFLEEEYEKDDGLLTTLAACYGGKRDDKDLARLIDELYSFSRSQPYPETWLKEGFAAFTTGGGLDSYPWSAFLLGDLAEDLAAARRSLVSARDLAVKEDIPGSWLVRVTSEIEELESILYGGSGLAGFCPALLGLSFAALPGAAKEGDKEAREEFRRLRDKGKKKANDLKKRFGQRAPKDMLADLRSLAPLMERLCGLVLDYGTALDREKRRRNLLDFDDMEHLCLRLLCDEENGVAAALREAFDELLIDEYQDINAVQERILCLLARGDNIFAVGDVKQSIYRFRLAEPALFLQKYREYGQGKGGRRIDLNRNYRSKGGVIAAVNYLFSQLMNKSSSELDYDESHELKAGQEDFGAKTELWLIDRNLYSVDAAAEDEDAEDTTLVAPDEDTPVLEARLLGRRILELQKEGYGLGDIAVLLRAAKSKESLLVREFTDMGIAAVAGSRPDYLQTAEISLILALLAIIDNPLQEPELAAVLRSPLYAFSLDELFQIRRAAPEEQLYDALAITAQGADELALKCRLFIERLDGWRDSLRFRRISELISDVYRETSLLQLAGALPRGCERQENLLLLIERAREYEAGGYRGLFRFLLFLADGRGKCIAEGLQLTEGEDAVRVMSIHRSKGLEFPVVIVANLGGNFALLEEKKDIL
ncbi:MAG: helicase-exonuclease AddAB subunit AddA, partial [Clostridiales bacterium]|nr:helicase-exonuclease AddAB subunit AddA [Clostridiales bacterium]